MSKLKIKGQSFLSEQFISDWLSRTTFPIFEAEIELIAEAFLFSTNEKEYELPIKAAINYLSIHGFKTISDQVWKECVRRSELSQEEILGLNLLGLFCVKGQNFSLKDLPPCFVSRKVCISPFFITTPLYAKLKQVVYAYQLKSVCQNSVNSFRSNIIRFAAFADERGEKDISIELCTAYCDEFNGNNHNAQSLVNFIDKYFELHWENPNTKMPFNALPLPNQLEAREYFSKLNKNSSPRLDMLVVKALWMIEERGYGKAAFDNYKKFLRRFQWYCFKRGETYLNESLYEGYLALENERSLKTSDPIKTQQRAIRTLRILSAASTNDILPDELFFKQILTLENADLETVRLKLQKYMLEERNLSWGYMKRAVLIFRQIIKICDINNTDELYDLTDQDLDLILEDFNLRHSKSVLASCFYVLKLVLSWMYEEHFVKKDFAKGIIMPRYIKTYDPPFLTVEDQQKLEKQLENEDVRTQAIILLCLYTGLRQLDIVALRNDHIDFKNKTLAIVQSKTKNSLELPLVDKVIEAINKYLNQRPKPYADGEQFFLSIVAPFKPLKQIYSIIRPVLKRAGVKSIRKPAHGSHLLRYSLAHSMMKNRTPHHVITDTLGHVSKDSDRPYLSMDEEMLLKCALDLSLIGKGRFAK